MDLVATIRASSIPTPVPMPTAIITIVATVAVVMHVAVIAPAAVAAVVSIIWSARLGAEAINYTATSSSKTATALSVPAAVTIVVLPVSGT